jgi:hypothetical protein
MFGYQDGFKKKLLIGFQSNVFNYLTNVKTKEIKYSESLIQQPVGIRCFFISIF